MSDINERDGEGCSKLHHAAAKGDLKEVQELVKQGIDINIRNTLGFTALSWAHDAGHREVVEFLLSKGAKAAGDDWNDWNNQWTICSLNTENKYWF